MTVLRHVHYNVIKNLQGSNTKSVPRTIKGLCKVTKSRIVEFGGVQLDIGRRSPVALKSFGLLQAKTPPPALMADAVS